MSLALLFQLNLADAGGANSHPTDIELSSSTVRVTSGLNAVVGSLSTVDADIGDTHTYSLVAGTGDTNNASFTIDGDNLLCNDPATLGVGVYSVRIQTSDGTDTYAEAFSITVYEGSGGSGLSFLSFFDFFVGV